MSEYIVSDRVKQIFADRLAKAVNVIEQSGLVCSYGLFGSYARGNYRAVSDIDLCIITECEPDRKIRSFLRDELEMLNVDVSFVTYQYFEESNDLFARNLRRDFKKLGGVGDGI